MILVTAALGIIGRETIAELNRRGARCRVLIPRADKQAELDDWFAAGKLDRSLIEFAIGDLDDPESLPAAVANVDAIVLIYPALDFDVAHVEALAKVAAGLPLRHIVHLTGIGADVNAPTRLGRMMAEAERIVASIGVPFTHVQPHMFLLMQNIRSFAAEIQRERTLRLPLGDARTSWIDARDIGRVLAAVVVETGNNETIVLTGPESLTGQELAELIGSAAGYVVSFEDLSPGQARQRLLASRMQPWLVEDSLIMFEAFRAGVAAGVSPAIERLTGSRARRFNQFAYEYSWAFRQGEEEGQLSGWLDAN